ncbi:MAG: helix-turn-helix domain-containing protein [Bacteroidota bacterium]
MMESKTIFFKEMPLFQRASFQTPFSMQGELKEFACFFYVTQGSMHSYDARGSFVTQPKNAILKNCGRYIQEFRSEEKDAICEAIAVYLYPALLKEIYKKEIPSFLTYEESPQPKKLIGNKLIEQYMHNLSIYFEEPEAFDEELGILKLKELMLILLKSENHVGIRQFLSETFTPVNIELKKAIENNLYNNLSIDQLAYICNMSVSTFKREFKKTFNDTPARYIKHRRLLAAEKRLLTTQDSITDIAFSLGFVDISTFSANFQEKFSLSPTKYRLTQKTD